MKKTEKKIKIQNRSHGDRKVVLVMAFMQKEF